MLVLLAAAQQEVQTEWLIRQKLYAMPAAICKANSAFREGRAQRAGMTHATWWEEELHWQGAQLPYLLHRDQSDWWVRHDYGTGGYRPVCHSLAPADGGRRNDFLYEKGEIRRES